MFEVFINATCGAYRFYKRFELVAVPEKGRGLMLFQNRVRLTPEWVTQDLDNNFFTVYCNTGLETLYDLYASETGWRVDNSQAFCADPVVKKVVVRRDARMAKVRAEIAKAESNK